MLRSSPFTRIPRSRDGHTQTLPVNDKFTQNRPIPSVSTSLSEHIGTVGCWSQPSEEVNVKLIITASADPVLKPDNGPG